MAKTRKNQLITQTVSSKSQFLQNTDNMALHKAVFGKDGYLISAYQILDSKSSVQTSQGSRKLMGADTKGIGLLQQANETIQELISRGPGPSLKKDYEKALPTPDVLSGLSCTGTHTTAQMPHLNKLNQLCPLEELFVSRSVMAEPCDEAKSKPEIDCGFAGYRTLAKDWDLPAEATRKSLERWRKDNTVQAGTGFIENSDAGPNETKWLYNRKAVEGVLQGMRSRQTKRKDKHPAGQ